MHPSISYSYVEKKETVRHGRIHITYTYLGDMQFNIPFSEFAKRSDPDHSEMIAHIVNNSDEESLVESIIKSGMGRKIEMELDRQFQQEAA
ncbi:hypothetical protein [Xenorhabdus hominickii]|uniref:Uncharacterized protein n=1 Tax=Xenorhabdus hominickii TaxID=351679 RepID=A0A2G0Q249_XENHO|nr:hypothetical protein [Xenorhabdus hominickii]AOM40211.1 hypothetical protein A9255_06230 [Xenorhabdus hominickii]PHM53287.1 hypothetical protein Xhom_04182 [Xenorhabdus hominickii]